MSIVSDKMTKLTGALKILVTVSSCVLSANTVKLWEKCH